MSRRALLVLAAIIAIGLALLALDRFTRPALPGVGDLLLPALTEQVESISVVAIIGPADDAVTTLELRDRQWVVAERNDWPADVDTLSRLMRALADARRIERMTENPERYARLGVADPRVAGASDGTAVELTFNGRITTVIIGETGVRSGDYSYLRVADETAAWLVDIAPTLPDGPAGWLDRRLLDLPATELERFTIEHADGERVELVRDADAGWQLETEPERPLLNDRVLENTANALANLRLEDVLATDGAPAVPDTPVRAEVVTEGGRTLQLALWQHDARSWLTAAWQADGDTDTPLPAAERLRDRAFAIPEHRFRQLTRRRDDLLASPDDTP